MTEIEFEVDYTIPKPIYNKGIQFLKDLGF